MKIDPQLKSVLQRHFEEEIEEKYDQVIVISPYVLSPEELLQITEKFPFIRAKKITNTVSTEIIGGFIIKHGSKLIDLSIKTLLQTVQHTLYETQS